jgi:hypothetical protein
VTWFATSANETEAGKERYFAFIAADFDFPSGHERFWTGIGDLTVLGNIYLGAGELVTVDGESESTDLGAQRKRYTLTGVDPSLVAETDIDGSFGRSVVEYLGFLDPDMRQLLAAPEVSWEGRIDSFRRVDGARPIIEVTAEHRLALLDRIDGWRYTHEHQQQFYAGDNGFDQVNAIQLKKVIWGGKLVDPAVQTPITVPGGPNVTPLHPQR